MTEKELHAGEAIPGRFRIGEWSIDSEIDEISRGSEVVKLEPRMMRLLCCLAESHGHVITPQQLLDSVWPGVVVGPASVYQAISALRKTLGDTGHSPTYIATVARKGYRLIPAVELLGNDEEVLDEQAASATPPRRRIAHWGMAATALAVVVVISAIVMLWPPGNEERSALPATKTAALAWPPPDLPSMSILPLQASTPGEANELFAATITDLLQIRLMTQKGLLLVSLDSAGKLGQPGADVREVGRRLHVGHVLRGDAAREANQMRVNLTLMDTSTGMPVWSQSYARATQDITRLREEIVASIGTRLNVRIGPIGNLPVNLGAHEECVRGFREFKKSTMESLRTSRDIYQRATELYPDYACNYVGLAVAVKLFQLYPDLRSSESAERLTELQRTALNRALELDPDSGIAIIERATITPDPGKAEQMFLRGMDLMPSYGWGPYSFTWYLLDKGRDGEAIAVIDHGLRIDPLNSALLGFKAGFLIDYRGDIAGQDAILREALANNPKDSTAALALGWSRYALSGETAEAIGIFEREVERDPAGVNPRQSAAAAYLDVDDPGAAESVGKGMRLPALVIAQYHHSAHPIASFSAEALSDWQGFCRVPFDPVANALRDEALATGQYAPALAAFEKARSTHPKAGLDTACMDLVHAHTLILSGDTERGHALVKSVLHVFEVEQVGRPPHWFARNRATAYALLGDDERTLAELTTSVQHNDLTYWWYTAELDPLFAHLRKDPRFMSLAETARQHRAQQRVLLDEMRRKGEVPKRPELTRR